MFDIDSIVNTKAAHLVFGITCPGCTSPAVGCAKSVMHDAQSVSFTLVSLDENSVECTYDPENYQFGGTIAIINTSGHTAWVSCGLCSNPQ